MKKMFEQYENVAEQLDAQRKELDRRDKELEEWEAEIDDERIQLFNEKEEANERAMLEKKKAEETMLKLEEDAKREKEKLLERIVELEKKLDDSQSMELEIAGTGKIKSLEKDLKDKEEELEDITTLYGAPMMKERNSNDELQEARKELIDSGREKVKRQVKRQRNRGQSNGVVLVVDEVPDGSQVASLQVVRVGGINEVCLGDDAFLF
ncbi:hypothetical protein C3L33_04552, partial [Rhododendron williamsianum]